MATITGQRLSNLSTLALGSTGTLFYAESAAGNSYKMPEYAVYDTLNKLHISGAYQPKNEDWRFIHKTGTESITGIKTFVSSILGVGLLGTAGTNGISIVGNSLVYGGNNIVKWGTEKILNDSSVATSLDWDNRRLSGNWNAEGLTIRGRNIITGNVVYTTGSQTISGVKSFADNINVGAGTFAGSTAGEIGFWSIEETTYNSLRAEDSDLVWDGPGNVSSYGLNSTILSVTTTADLPSTTVHNNLNILNFTITSGLVISGKAPSTPTSPGYSGQCAISGQKLFICSGANQWGYINITAW